MLSARTRTFLWIIASLAVVGIFVAIAVWPTGADEWDAMSGRVDQLKAEARSRRFPRSVLNGEPRPGKAWDQYDLALNEAAKWSEADDTALAAFYQKDGVKADRAKVERLVAERANEIEHLRLGAQRFDGQYSYNWDRVGQMMTPNSRDNHRLLHLAVAQARIWTDSGRVQDAADLLLDASAFSRDLATNGTPGPVFAGFVMYQTALEELGRLVQSGKLTQQQLSDLAKKFDTLDHDFPAIGPTFSNDTMALGIYSQKAVAGGPMGDEMWATLRAGGVRFALAPKAMMREAYEAKEAFLKRSVKFDQMPFAAVKEAADAISAQTAASSNEVVRVLAPNLLKMVVAQRETLAQLRLLRAGTIYLSTGTIPTLDDPFGDKLFYQQQGGNLKIWSIGSDGKNNDGTAGPTKRQDIVLQISK